MPVRSAPAARLVRGDEAVDRSRGGERGGRKLVPSGRWVVVMSLCLGCSDKNAGEASGQTTSTNSETENAATSGASATTSSEASDGTAGSSASTSGGGTSDASSTFGVETTGTTGAETSDTGCVPEESACNSQNCCFGTGEGGAPLSCCLNGDFEAVCTAFCL